MCNPEFLEVAQSVGIWPPQVLQETINEAWKNIKEQQKRVLLTEGKCKPGQCPKE